MNYQSAMTTALENTYVLLAMMDQVGRDELLDNRMDIAPAMARAEEHLTRLWEGQDVQFPDFDDVMQVAGAVARQIWNPNHKDFIQRNAVQAINDRGRAENWHQVAVEKKERITLERIHPLGNDVMGLAKRVIRTQDLTSRHAISVFAGAEAVRELSRLRAEVQDQEERMGYSTATLPVMSLDGAYGPVFDAWTKALGVTRVLPEADAIRDIIHEAKVRGEVPENVVSAAADRWIGERPELPEDWVRRSVETLAAAATSQEITSKDEPAEWVASRLAAAAEFQSSIATGYKQMAETYSVSAQLDQAMVDARLASSKVRTALDEIELAMGALESINPITDTGQMSLSDRAKMHQLEDLRQELALRVADLPMQLEEFADRIRAASPEEDQGPRLAMG